MTKRNKIEEEVLKAIITRLHDLSIHYTHRADVLLNSCHNFNLSQRKAAEMFLTSKSEIYRMLSIAKLSLDVKLAAEKYDIEKYVLIELAALKASGLARHLEHGIISGQITKYSQVRLGLKSMSGNLN